MFTIPVPTGACIDIFADNGEGAADLVAQVVDASGQTFGLQDDHAQLHDEVTCSAQPISNGAACPSRAVTGLADGDLAIAIAQWENGCTDDAEYSLHVAVNGDPVDLSTATFADNTPIID